MPLITTALLEEKLTTWVLSSQVHKVLGFTEEQASTVKDELNTLVDLGIVARDGARRGLKFRLASIVDPDPSEEDGEPASDDIPSSDIRGYIRERDSLRQDTSQKTFWELLEWVTNANVAKDPSITSVTLGLKKTSDGEILVSSYMGCVPLNQKSYSPDEFLKFLRKSIAPKEPKK